MSSNIIFSARNILFCADYFESKEQSLIDEIIVPTYYFNELIEQFDNQEVLYINLYNIVNGKSYMVTLGMAHNSDPSIIFVPQWILDNIDYTDGSIQIEVVNIADLMEGDITPIATKIIITPRDIYAFDIDIRNCVENALMNLHSIREGCVIPIIDGDVEILIYIQKVEPAPLSLIVTGEIEVEFVNEFSKEFSKEQPIIPDIIPEQIGQLEQSSNIPLYTPIYQPVTIPRASSIDIIQAWDYYQAEERQKYIREARMKKFK